MTLDDIRRDRALVQSIDWEMTPEEAITLYLEWGNNWSHGNMVKSGDQTAHYFVIYSWEDPPKVLFIRRNSGGAEELARLEMPPEMGARFLASHRQGVWGLTDEVRGWLEDELN